MTHDAPSGSPLDSTQACTIVLRGASSHLLDEAERSLHDALCVLSQVRPDAGLNARTVRRSSAIQKLTPTPTLDLKRNGLRVLETKMATWT